MGVSPETLGRKERDSQETLQNLSRDSQETLQNLSPLLGRGLPSLEVSLETLEGRFLRDSRMRLSNERLERQIAGAM